MASNERRILDDFELIGESDTREAARVEAIAADLAEVFVEDYFLERRAFEETAPFEHCEALTTRKVHPLEEGTNRVDLLPISHCFPT